MRARVAAADALAADQDRAAQARDRLKALPGQGARRILGIGVAAAIIAAVVLGYLAGSRSTGKAPLAEPLQLRLERSLGTYRP